MTYRCRDCKDTKTYQGLGAPEPCRSCLYDGEQRSPRLNHVSIGANGKVSIQLAGPVADAHRATRTLPAFTVGVSVDDVELMRLINAATRTGVNLQEMLKGRKLVHTVTH